MWEKDSHVRSQAFSMWANYVETGSVITSVNDLINCGREQDIKRLESSQVRFVKRLRGWPRQSSSVTACSARWKLG